MLGDLLSEIERAAADGRVAAMLDDVSLLAEVAAAAAFLGIDPDSYILSAVRSFEVAASDEDWVTLMAAATASKTPGNACLQRMVRFALTKDAIAWSSDRDK